MITCLTPPISEDAANFSAPITVEYDAGMTRQLASQTFTYYDNPVVTLITPLSAYRR